MKKIVRWLFDDVGPVLERVFAWTMATVFLLLPTFPVIAAILFLSLRDGEFGTDHWVVASLLAGAAIVAIVCAFLVYKSYKAKGSSALELSELFPHLMLISFYWIIVPTMALCMTAVYIEYGLEKLNKWSHTENEN